MIVFAHFRDYERVSRCSASPPDWDSLPGASCPARVCRVVSAGAFESYGTSAGQAVCRRSSLAWGVSMEQWSICLPGHTPAWVRAAGRFDRSELQRAVVTA